MDLSRQRPILARRREVQRSLRTDVGCDGAERSNQIGSNQRTEARAGRTTVARRRLDGRTSRGPPAICYVRFTSVHDIQSLTTNVRSRGPAPVTIIQRTSAIRTRSSKAAGRSPAKPSVWVRLAEGPTVIPSRSFRSVVRSSLILSLIFRPMGLLSIDQLGA